MFTTDSGSDGGVSRRDFLRAAGVGALGLGGAGASAPSAADDRAVILLLLVGGPSQLDTFDPKPDAPSGVRGPFGSIGTAVPGVRVCEHLPRLARRLDRVTIVRSLHHDAAPIHETGHQLIQTGGLAQAEPTRPTVGSVAARVLGPRGGLPPFVTLPGPIGSTGVAISHGQSAGDLGDAFDPFPLGADPASAAFDPRTCAERASKSLSARSGTAFDLAAEGEGVRDAYGRSKFGQSCLLARRLVEAGTRVVVVNMYETVFDRVSWDCHGSRPFSTLDDYARHVLPDFDRAYAALLDDLARRGRLDSTLVVASGEFGRTPRLNAAGGRDHWPGCWSALLAGGGTPGGAVLGASDRQAAEPADRPATPADLVATMYRALRIDPGATLVGRDGRTPALPAAAASLI